MSHQDSPERAAPDEKQRRASTTEVPDPTGWSSLFGGPDVAIGPRIGPVLSSISMGSESETDQSSTAILDKQLAEEDGHAIKYRTCSWQKVRAVPPRRPFLAPLGSFVVCSRMLTTHGVTLDSWIALL